MNQNYVFKKDQLKKLVKQFNNSLTNEKISFRQLKKLITKIKKLANELKSTLTSLELKKVLGVTSLLIGFAFSNQAVAQNFPSHTKNPFSLSMTHNELPAKGQLVDLDNDGDLDIFMAEEWEYGFAFYYYENEGTPSVPKFKSSVKRPFNIDETNVSADSDYNPMFVDIDNDGDLDLFTTGTDYVSNGKQESKYAGLLFFENEGTASAPSFKEPVFEGLTQTNDDDPKMYYSECVLMDADGDGDYDLLSFNANEETYSFEDADYIISGGALEYFENTGTTTAHKFEWKSENPFGFTPSVINPAAASGDIDLDGDTDLLIFQEVQGYGDVHYYENTGTSSSTTFATSVKNAPFSISLESSWGYMHPMFGDLDNDGDLDLMVSAFDVQEGDNGTSSFYYYENTAASTNTALTEETQETSYIYPNPVQNVLNIETEKSVEKVEIFNVLGQVVLSTNQDANTISVEKLPMGIYTVRVVFSEGNYVLKKIQKQ